MEGNKIFAKHYRYLPICIDNLMKRMDGLTKVVKKNFPSILPEKFALFFEGWSSCNTNFIAIVANFPTENENGSN